MVGSPDPPQIPDRARLIPALGSVRNNIPADGMNLCSWPESSRDNGHRGVAFQLTHSVRPESPGDSTDAPTRASILFQLTVLCPGVAGVETWRQAGAGMQENCAWVFPVSS